MNACAAELKVPPEALGNEIIRLAEDDGAIFGFYRLVVEIEEAELEAMFVDPNMIGKGAGVALWRDMLEQLSNQNAKKLICQSDPNAEGFYRARGMVRIGERASESTPGRMLPVLEMALGR